MSSDRPGFRNSTHLVGRGVVQIENGLGLFGEEGNGERVGIAMQPEIRIGVMSWLEVRLYADSVILRSPYDRSAQERPFGTSDLQPGIKFPIFGRKGGHTRLVGILRSGVPSGHSSQSTGGFEPASELIGEHELTSTTSLAGTWHVTRRKEDHFVWQHAGSAALNRSFGELWRALVEVYALSPVRSASGNLWAADIAVSRTIRHNVSVDVSLGRSVHGPRTWFAAFGFAVRSHLPHSIPNVVR